MSNIEIPENIKVNAQRVLDGQENYLSTTVALAEFILGLNKPEIEVENFVVYKVKCADKIYAGFRFSSELCWKKWSLVDIGGDHDAEYAVPQINTSILAEDSDVEVLERWTPDAPQPEFGIGDDDGRVEVGREVLVKGVLYSTYADGDGDTLVTFRYSGDATESHYVNTADIAYADGGR